MYGPFRCYDTFVEAYIAHYVSVWEKKKVRVQKNRFVYAQCWL